MSVGVVSLLAGLPCPCGGNSEQLDAIYVKTNLSRNFTGCLSTQDALARGVISSALEEVDYASKMSEDMRARREGNTLLITYGGKGPSPVKAKEEYLAEKANDMSKLMSRMAKMEESMEGFQADNALLKETVTGLQHNDAILMDLKQEGGHVAVRSFMDGCKTDLILRANAHASPPLTSGQVNGRRQNWNGSAFQAGTAAEIAIKLPVKP